MRIAPLAFALPFLCVVPSVSFAAHFGSPCNVSCSVHANTSTQYLVTGNAPQYGLAYYDIYDGSTFLCETNVSNNTPIWSCNATLTALGSHTITAIIKGTSQLHAPGDNATLSVTVVP